MKKTLLALGALLLAAAAYLLFWPVPVTPVAWNPPEAPALPATVLEAGAVERLARGELDGPEFLLFDEDGGILTGLEDGRVVALTPDETQVGHPPSGDARAEPVAPGALDEDSGPVPETEDTAEAAPATAADSLTAWQLETRTNTRGRPLGLQGGGERPLYIADGLEGLLRFADGYVHALSLAQGAKPYRLVNNLALSQDGSTLWFGDSSARYGREELRYEMLESRGHGRLLEYDLATDAVRLLADGLHFPNGIVAGPEERYLLVAETTRYRVLRYWLKGDKQGEIEVFADNLPGFPDNLSFNGEDRFWVALAAPRSRALDWLLPRPGLRKVAARLPRFLQPAPPEETLAVALDREGRITHLLRATGEDAYAPVTSVVERGEWLYLGSVREDAIGRIPLDTALEAGARGGAAFKK